MPETSVNLPDFVVAADGAFPAEPDLSLLFDLRAAISKTVQSFGLRELGAGMGCGGADVCFYFGDRRLSVFISITDPNKEPVQ